MHLYQDQAFNISAILSANLDVLEVNDLNRAKLAKHNLSREQLEPYRVCRRLFYLS